MKKDAIAILCAGGPSPGINTVIGSVTKVFLYMKDIKTYLQIKQNTMNSISNLLTLYLVAEGQLCK